MLFLTTLNLLSSVVSGDILDGIFTAERRQALGDDVGRTPTNVLMETAENAITIHWTPPGSAVDASFCIVAYRASGNPSWIRIPVPKDQRTHVIRGLNSDTLYQIQLYCLYGSLSGPTVILGASTRTVSVEPSVCPGSLPNAFLEPFCILTPSYSSCDFTCQDGYRKMDFPYIKRGHRNSLEEISILVFCEDGAWVTDLEEYGYGINEICLPEADFHKCPPTIPNGVLEPHCGPATDWLCNFECASGYRRHVYMAAGFLKSLPGAPEMLYCDNGIWKTGYEDLNLDVSGVCVGQEHNCTDSDAFPHGEVYVPCPSGYLCSLQCDRNYHKHILATQNTARCMDGVWVVMATKYDPNITPQNLCAPDDASVCPAIIPNGRMPDPSCKRNCRPDCNEGFYVPRWNGPRLTCEDGKWLTQDVPYTGDNICFPEGGYVCSSEIPNGISSEHISHRRDDGYGRLRLSYTCNDGFRKHRIMSQIECVAGNWVTNQERFGLGISAVCVPYSS